MWTPAPSPPEREARETQTLHDAPELIAGKSRVVPVSWVTEPRASCRSPRRAGPRTPAFTRPTSPERKHSMKRQGTAGGPGRESTDEQKGQEPPPCADQHGAPGPPWGRACMTTHASDAGPAGSRDACYTQRRHQPSECRHCTGQVAGRKGSRARSDCGNPAVRPWLPTPRETSGAWGPVGLFPGLASSPLRSVPGL